MYHLSQVSQHLVLIRGKAQYPKVIPHIEKVLARNHYIRCLDPCSEILDFACKNLAYAASIVGRPTAGSQHHSAATIKMLAQRERDCGFIKWKC